MKKFVSAVLAGAMAFSAMSAVSASAESYGHGKNIVLLGDSIAAGTGLDASEYNYGEIIADYVWGNVENYAHSGDTSEEMLAMIQNLSDEKKADIEKADSVIISIGGNDIIHYAANDLLQFAASVGCLADGVELSNIPADAGLSDLMKIIDKDKVKAYATSAANKYTLNKRLLELGKKISFTTADDTRGQYTNYMLIQNVIVPNIVSAVNTVREMNPYAQIIVQTIYNPLELQKEYLAANFNETYQTLFTSLLPIFDDVLNSYSAQVTAALKDMDNVKIADVKKNFDASDSVDTGSSWYFTGMQRDGDARDIHPNQTGHLEIAATILDTMGVKPEEDGGLFRTLYYANAAKDSYPAAAKSGAEQYLGSYTMGDADGNNNVDSNDASAILKEYSAISTKGEGEFSETASMAADVDHVGGVTSTDASAVLKYYASAATGGKTTYHAFYTAENPVEPEAVITRTAEYSQPVNSTVTAAE